MTTAERAGVLPEVKGTPYDPNFYDEISEGSFRSAKVVVPLVMQLTKPRSVVDIGCGVGTWLQVFAQSGVEDFLGLDGNYVQPSMLRIPQDRFRPTDLTQPQSLGREFDLAVSLEVAEHLPESAALRFVQFLTDAAPMVLFSAAVPCQGGTHHVNEQWPWYWRELFAARGYIQLDPIRALVWKNPDVEWWYRQNVFLFVRQSFLLDRPKFAREHEASPPLAIVNESVLRENLEHQHSLRNLLRELPKAAWRSLCRRF